MITQTIQTADLQPGDLIHSQDGDTGTVEAILVIPDADQRMYNLTVAEAHTFFVGAGDWLVQSTLRLERGQVTGRDKG